MLVPRNQGRAVRRSHRHHIGSRKALPGIGALIASLPLVSVLGMMWLWKDKPDAANMAAHAQATFWFVLPSSPMFLLFPAMLRHGFTFWTSLVLGCVFDVALYGLMTWAGTEVRPAAVMFDFHCGQAWRISADSSGEPRCSVSKQGQTKRKSHEIARMQQR
jgi:hypothetical protein